MEKRTQIMLLFKIFNLFEVLLSYGEGRNDNNGLFYLFYLRGHKQLVS